MLVNPKVRGKARAALVEAARAGGNLDPQNARYVRVIEYEVPDREGDGKDEVIALITTIVDFPDAVRARRIPSMALTSRVALPETGRDDHRSCTCGSSSS